MLIRGDHQLLKSLNRTQVLEIIRRFGPVSKAKVAEHTRLTFAAVSNIIKDLEAAGMIEARGEGKSSGGRKPILYELNPAAFYVVAVDLSVEWIWMSVMDPSTRELAGLRIPAPPDGEPESYIRSAVEGVRRIVEEAGVTEKKILGVGISSPGPVNAATGEVYDPPNLPRWGVVSLKERMEDALRLPVKVEKDANLSALGEKWFGSAREMDNLIYVLIGEGLGAGIIIDGSLYNGHGFGAGEIGHVTVDLNGPRCNCGNYGCLEAMASGIAVTREIRSILQRGDRSEFYASHDGEITFPDVLNALRAGDELTQRVVEKASYILGIGLTGVLNSFHPEGIFIGGKLPQAFPAMVAIAEKVARERAVSVFRDRMVVFGGELGERSSLVGAAALVMESMFTFRL